MSTPNRNSSSAAPADSGVSAVPEPVPPKCVREGVKARQAFRLYCELGAERSIREVARRLGKHDSQIGVWSSKYHWRQRCDEFDAERERKESEAAEAAYLAAKKKWAVRAEEVRETAHRQGQQASEQADLMFKYPLTDVTRVVERDEDGREKHTQIIKAARWGKRDAIRFAQAGLDLRAAAIRNEIGTASSQVTESDMFLDVPLEPAKKEPK